jgi:hypothetical protein
MLGLVVAAPAMARHRHPGEDGTAPIVGYAAQAPNPEVADR